MAKKIYIYIDDRSSTAGTGGCTVNGARSVLFTLVHSFRHPSRFVEVDALNDKLSVHTSQEISYLSIQWVHFHLRAHSFADMTRAEYSKKKSSGSVDIRGGNLHRGLTTMLFPCSYFR